MATIIAALDVNVKFNFLNIVMNVALFYTKNRSESSTFCIILFQLLGDDCQSIPIFFL
jgi:hypothetical protein